MYKRQRLRQYYGGHGDCATVLATLRWKSGADDVSVFAHLHGNWCYGGLPLYSPQNVREKLLLQFDIAEVLAENEKGLPL